LVALVVSKYKFVHSRSPLLDAKEDY